VQELAEDAANRLAGADQRRFGCGEARFQREFAARHVANAFPEARAGVGIAGQPDDQAILIRHGLPQEARIKRYGAPIWFLHAQIIWL